MYQFDFSIFHWPSKIIHLVLSNNKNKSIANENYRKSFIGAINILKIGKQHVLGNKQQHWDNI